MKAVYLDNFRGFSNALVPLEQVNFLVGENSTGKSSFLNLINIISDDNFFWFHSYLRVTDFDLGNFDDIVSAESDDRSNFTIGFVSEYSKVAKDEANVPDFGYLIVSYKKDKDKIRPYKFSYIENGLAVIVKTTSKNIVYKHIEFEENVDSIEAFSFAIKAHVNEAKGFSYIKEGDDEGIPPIDQMPFFFVKELVKNHVKGVKSKSSQFSFSVPQAREEVVWLAPIRDKPKRIYDNIKPGFSPEGTHTPHLLNEILFKGDKTSIELTKALKKFGSDSGLFKNVISKRYGKSEASPFEIDVTLSEIPIKISNVGYGVAQVLPIIVESFIRRKTSTFCIQQPEVHLHPKAQAALGGFFHDLSKKENKRFLIETHSDFLIDRYRIHQSKSKKKTPSQILYFERGEKQNKVHLISIEGDGSFSDNQPETFRNFFLNEQLELLDI